MMMVSFVNAEYVSVIVEEKSILESTPQVAARFDLLVEFRMAVLM